MTVTTPARFKLSFSKWPSGCPIVESLPILLLKNGKVYIDYYFNLTALHLIKCSDCRPMLDIIIIFLCLEKDTQVEKVDICFTEVPCSYYGITCTEYIAVLYILSPASPAALEPSAFLVHEIHQLPIWSFSPVLMYNIPHFWKWPRGSL